MTRKYAVSCYSPPSALVIKSGQTAEVVGWKAGNKIRAKSIINVTENGPACNCGPPPKALLAEEVKLIGKVSNVQHSSDGIQFNIETEE